MKIHLSSRHLWSSFYPLEPVVGCSSRFRTACRTSYPAHSAARANSLIATPALQYPLQERKPSLAVFEVGRFGGTWSRPHRSFSCPPSKTYPRLANISSGSNNPDKLFYDAEEGGSGLKSTAASGVNPLHMPTGLTRNAQQSQRCQSHRKIETHPLHKSANPLQARKTAERPSINS